MRKKLLGLLLGLCGASCMYAQENTGNFFFSKPVQQDEMFLHSDSIVPEVYVRAINISGNKKTKPSIIGREIAFRQGVVYETKELDKLIRRTREQLMNTALFVTVDLSVDSLTAFEWDVNILVKERWYLFPLPHFKIVDRNWNVWLNEYKGSLDRAEIGGKVIHNNLTGRNDKLNLFGITGYSQQFAANYFQPYFDKKLQQGYGFGFVYSKSREVNFATDSNKQQFITLPDFGRKFIRAEVGYSYRKGSQMRSSARLSYNLEEVDSLAAALNPNMFGGGKNRAQFVDLTVNYQYLNVDYIPYPLRGWLVDLYAIQRFSKQVPMFQIGGKMQGTWSFAPKTYLNFQGAFAFTLPFNHQPFYNTRMLGYGSLYMQGLELNVVDGTAGGMLRSTLRREVCGFTIRNLFRSKTHNEIPFRFFVKTYGNIGYVYAKNPGTSYMNNMLLSTAGFGLDIMTVYDLVMKLEYSYNQFGQHGFFIHTATDF